MYAISYNLEELKENNIREILSGDLIDEETTPDIVDQLIKMNEEGFLTFESQPAETTYQYINDKYDYNWIKRAYVNGLYPSNKVGLLIQQINKTNPNIIISETILDPRGWRYDKLILWNFEDDIDRKNTVDDLYPMAMTYDSKARIEYHSGYSGDINVPADRDEYMEDFTDELLQDIYNNKMSLIEIWSRDIEDNIFPIVLFSLKQVNKILKY